MYALVYASCFACKKPFGFNPKSVPSYNNQPICRDCVEKANATRKANGLRLWPVAPDAYEPVAAEELDGDCQFRHSVEGEPNDQEDEPGLSSKERER